MTFTILHGNNLEVLPTLADNSVDSIVTDPPYELGFMGKGWDSSGIAYSVQLWTECLFTGSGSTGKAAILNGFDFIGIEMTEEYLPIIKARLEHAETEFAKVQADGGLF